MLQVGAMVCLTLASIMIYYSFARKTYPGFQHWTAGFVCIGIGAVFVSMRTIFPSFVSIIIGNTLIVLMPLLLSYGLTIFLDIKWKLLRLNITLTLLFIIAFLWWTYITPSLYVRTICLSTVMSFFFAQSLYISIKYIPFTLEKQEWSFVSALAISTISSGFRATVTILSMDDIKFIHNVNMLQSISLLLIILSVASCACSILILNSYRLENDLTKAKKKIENIVNIDDLCKIYNRRYFNHKIIQEFNRHQRSSTPLSLIMVDIDCFKLYNDTYGHQAGDQCLIKIASILANSVNRPSDITARYGGEEFALLLPNTNSRGAQNIAKRIQEEMKRASIPHKGSTITDKVTLSIGISTVIPEKSASPDLLIKHADDSLYTGKQNGKNQIQVYVEA